MNCVKNEIKVNYILKIGQAEYIDNNTYFLHFIFNFAYDQVISETFLLDQYEQLIEALNK